MSDKELFEELVQSLEDLRDFRKGNIELMVTTIATTTDASGSVCLQEYVREKRKASDDRQKPKQ